MAAHIPSLRNRLPFISQSALSSILEVAASEALPEQASRRTIRRARDDIAHEHTPYGHLHRKNQMQFKSGPEIELEVQDPLPMLYWSCASSHGLSELVAKAAALLGPDHAAGSAMSTSISSQIQALHALQVQDAAALTRAIGRSSLADAQNAMLASAVSKQLSKSCSCS